MAITQTELVSEEAYRLLALADSQGLLELHHGQLREKPGMSVEHNGVMMRLVELLHGQLDRREFRVRAGNARVRCSTGTYYVPDVAVVPTALELALREHPGSLDAYTDPLPVVVEIWSPSTGTYDIDRKVPAYQEHGDLEIWRIHPYEQTVTTWRRQEDGSYTRSVYRNGSFRLVALPNVVIELAELFAP